MNANANQVAKTPELPEPVARRGITEAQWRTLKNNLFPGADSDSVLMVWDYCVARKLDPLKKPCHIVPMQVKDARSGEYIWRDVVMAGVYEYRTTAMRTGLYLGHSKPEYGPTINYLGADVPEYCEITVYRWNKEAQCKTEFPVRVYFKECAATRKDKKTGAPMLNDRWSKAGYQMLTKCTEAAGLREGFPDELGGVQTMEETEGRVIDVPFAASPMDGIEAGDSATVDKIVSRVAEILDEDGGDDGEIHADRIFAIHQEICNDTETYTSVRKALQTLKIITPTNWDRTVAAGSKRFQANNVEVIR